ncbi:hypothetical protein P8610_16005 [Fictibacillus sp. UD]
MIGVKGKRLLRDKRSGETPRAQSGKGLTACPAESETPVTKINHFQALQCVKINISFILQILYNYVGLRKRIHKAK